MCRPAALASKAGLRTLANESCNFNERVQRRLTEEQASEDAHRQLSGIDGAGNARYDCRNDLGTCTLVHGEILE